MLLAYYYPSSYVAWVLLVLYNLMIMIHTIGTLLSERRPVCRIRDEGSRLGVVTLERWWVCMGIRGRAKYWS